LVSPAFPDSFGSDRLNGGSKALGLPLDVFVVRKLGTPGQPELAIGAIATGGVRALNEEVVRRLGIPMEVIDAVTGGGKAGIETARPGLPW
jgi:predicted phosphoribosyltransferase